MDPLFPTSTLILVLAGRDFCQSVVMQMKHDKYAILFSYLVIKSVSEEIRCLFSLPLFLSPHWQISYTSGSSLQVPKVHGMISFSGEKIIVLSLVLYIILFIMAVNRTNGGPGCSALEGVLQENGVKNYLS